MAYEKRASYMSAESYHPVVTMPEGSPVFDLSTADAVGGMLGHEWGIGKYNEKRLNVYRGRYHGDRNIHMGVDLFGPVGTPVHTFADGEIMMTGNNAEPGDYGYTIITEHNLRDRFIIYALYGHLSEASVANKQPGQPITQGEVIGWMGNQQENGGWPPHVHFQLAWQAPKVCDMPGVVSDDYLQAALKFYPDPRLVLGPIYDNVE
jgi:murein DD-endopeptidase MepM/ murein hydrolase activator NlpD